ncbi:MAG TPA: ketol-acid reductoisomerase, partial [Flavobacteriaceae bacterium]|nr:ketol-acid reductoisomerase [Flavobacteriaceae bacterium]
MENYFNTLSLREKLKQLGKCRFMDASEFAEGIKALDQKRVVILGCGAQGLNQGLNMRDSGLDVYYALRQEAIEQQRESYQKATQNG